jgi:hypothetical protein
MHVQVSVLREPDGASSIVPWAIVLAGGAGVRLRPLVRQLCGDDARSSLRRSSGPSRCWATRPLSAFLLSRKIAERPPESCFRHIGFIRRTLKRLCRFFRRITSSLRKARLHAPHRESGSLRASAAFADCVGRNTGEHA